MYSKRLSCFITKWSKGAPLRREDDTCSFPLSPLIVLMSVSLLPKSEYIALVTVNLLGQDDSTLLSLVFLVERDRERCDDEL